MKKQVFRDKLRNIVIEDSLHILRDKESKLGYNLHRLKLYIQRSLNIKA